MARLIASGLEADKGLKRGCDDGKSAAMKPLDDQQQAARDWFESLRTRICAAFEEIEREADSDASFAYTPWDREDAGGEPGGTKNGGGGVRGHMAGKVFEKVGVNVSTVGGAFSPEFARSIAGAEDDPGFFATGISLVAHMANPHVPAVHMNTRFLTTTKRWFGGGADLNPAIPYAEDTESFHARLRAACAAHDPTFYPRFSKWAEDYFWLPHRGVPRGVGGIFYDHLEDHFDAHFAFTRDVGEAFLDIFPQLVRKRMGTPFTAAEQQRLLEFRGRYVEFNLLYDRGTLFGLKTGGNIDAILMSLPPLARWA
jgi:coproporphyrinogen III oxidase